MKKILTILWMALLTIGIVFPNFYPSLFEKVSFGAASYPTSLDTTTTLPNPGATDSVATVSHSGLHTNENGAIEALEAKLGLNSSTAVTNSIFAGNGAGNSLWTTYATATNINATGLGLFGSLISQASSTIVGGLTITGNSTTTQATTTNLAITALNAQIPYANANGSITSLGIGVGLSLSGGTLTNSTSAGQTVTGSVATSSTNTTYKAKTLSVVNGDQVFWWGECSHTGGGQAVTSRFKWSNNSASSTMQSANQGSGDSASVFGFAAATTTQSVTVEVLAGSCDAGMEFMTQLFH